MSNLDHFAHVGGFIAGGLTFSLAKPAGYESPSRRRRWEARGTAFPLVAFAFAALYPSGASAVLLPVHPAWAKALAAGYQVQHLAYRIAAPEFRWVYTEEPERIMDPGSRLVTQGDRRMQLLAYWRWEPALEYHPGAVLNFQGVWYHDGAEVEEFSGMVDAPDPPGDLIYFRSASPVGVGSEFVGTWEVVVTTDSLIISRMRLDIEGTDPPQDTK